MRDDASAPEATCSGFALRLDGLGYAQIPRTIQDDFTLEAWIRTTASLPGSAHYEGRSVIDADVIGIRNDFATAILNERFAFGVGNDTTLSSTSVVTTGNWTHVAATRRASTGEMEVFIDGRLDASVVSDNRASLADPLAITFGGAVSSRRFIGDIDEVRLWSVVRTAEEIDRDMRETLSGNEAGLAGYFRFDDRGAQTTGDSSAAALPAALLGLISYVQSHASCPPL